MHGGGHFMFERKILSAMIASGMVGCSTLSPNPPAVPAETKASVAPENESIACANQVKAFSQTSVVASAKSQKPSVDLLFWCTKAAEKGDARSQWVLAGLYERGIGVTASQSEALRWYKASATQGNADAQFRVGQIYGRGEGVPQDRNEATRWYLKAAEQGHIEAAYYMGYSYQHGKGATQNFPEAVRWYSKAAELGNTQAMHGLGTLYLQGQGLPQNQVEAYKWFNLAAVSGEKEFSQSRDRLAKKLSSAQLAEGQRLASEWAKKHPQNAAKAP